MQKILARVRTATSTIRRCPSPASAEAHPAAGGSSSSRPHPQCPRTCWKCPQPPRPGNSSSLVLHLLPRSPPPPSPCRSSSTTTSSCLNRTTAAAAETNCDPERVRVLIFCFLFQCPGVPPAYIPHCLTKVSIKFYFIVFLLHLTCRNHF